MPECNSGSRNVIPLIATMTKAAAVYIRVSGSKKVSGSPIGKIEDKFLQNPKVQLEPLIKLIQARQWQLPINEDVRKPIIYEDRMSGASTSRPAYKRLMEDARRGLFQVVVVWRFDRFARSTKELINALEEFRSLGIDFVSHQEAIDTSTPAGKMMFTIIAAFAEFEREITRDRILAGLDYARENGTKSGKTIGRQKSVVRRDEVLRLRQEGYSYREIGRELGIAHGLAYRICSETHQSQKGEAG